MEPKTKLDEFTELIEKGGKLEDFCENYHMNDPIKEIIFNRKYNDPKFIHVFYKENDYSKRLFKSIDYRIKDQNNAIFVIHGEPHLGKSEFAQALAKYTEKRFSDLLDIHQGIAIAFSMMEFDEIIRDLPPGKIVIFDEDPSEAGTDSKVIRDSLNNLLKIGRVDQNFFFFCSPVRVETAVVTYFLEAGGKNKEDRMLRFILYDPNYQNGKIPLGRVKIRLHDDEEFRKNYEMRKKRNVKVGKQQGMIYTHQINEARRQEQVQRLVDFCTLYDARTYDRIESYLSKYNYQRQQEGREREMITGSVKYKKMVIQDAYDILNYINRENKEDKNDIEIPEISTRSIEGSGFSNYLEDYYVKNLPETIKLGNKKRNKLISKMDIIETLKSWIFGNGIRDISVSIKNLHQGNVNDIIKLFKDGKRNASKIPDEWRVYKVYEYWCCKKYELEVVSGHGKQDFNLSLTDGTKIPGECKLWDDIKNNIALDKEEKLHSYKELKDKIPSFPVLWRNVKWGDQDYFFDVSTNGDLVFNFKNDERSIIVDKKQLKRFYQNY